MARSIRRLTILHTNDIHGHLQPWMGWEGELAGRTIGGVDRLATAVKAERARSGGNSLLLLDAGDAISDTMLAAGAKGRAVIHALNALGYDAMTVGNHEPDFGVDELLRRMDEARFPVLAANLRYDNGREFTKSYVLREIGGVKLGIIGVAYPNTPLTTARKNTAGLKFEHPAGIVREIVAQVRSEGAELVIVLAHYGLGAEKKLAASAPGVDVIIGGHSHNRMRSAIAAGGTLLVQAGAHCSDLGVLELAIENGRIVSHERRLITLDNSAVDSDPELAELVESYRAPRRTKLTAAAGSAATPIIRAQTIAGQEPARRDQESPADRLFADILRDVTGAEVALLPGVGYGVAIQPGPFTAEALRNLLPHESKVVTMLLTGAQIRRILEQAVENVYTDDPRVKVGGMIQVSGIRFWYEPGRTYGARITRVLAGGKDLEPARAYTVATNSMLAEGGHNYRTFLEGTEARSHSPEFEMVRAWLESHADVAVPQGGRMRPLGPQMDMHAHG